MYKMGTSKAPKTTRTVPASTSADDEHEKEEIQLPDVPEHWEFNDLLVNIGNAMTHEDLEEIKARFKGTVVCKSEKKTSILKSVLYMLDIMVCHRTNK